MTQSPQKLLVSEMQQFLSELPPSLRLDWTKDTNFLFHFEAARMLLMYHALDSLGLKSQQPLRVLDFGYLHGLVPEFLHRKFPQARFHVMDHPGSPVFSNSEYLETIKRRDYLQLEARSLETVADLEGTFDLIILGEIIEHLDPTTAQKAFTALRQKIAPDGVLLVTTPNGAGFYNTMRTLVGKDAQSPPIPDAMMCYPHIHLWSANLLTQTLLHSAWKPHDTFYYHGRDGEAFVWSNKKWNSLRHQLFMKITLLLCTLKPNWRGFFVMTAKPLSGT